MNERIRELAYKAGLHNHLWLDIPDSDDVIDTVKFAELIVIEMCQVMKAEGEQFSLDQNFDAVKGVGRCMRKVKQHFGVAE